MLAVPWHKKAEETSENAPDSHLLDVRSVCILHVYVYIHEDDIRVRTGPKVAAVFQLSKEQAKSTPVMSNDLGLPFIFLLHYRIYGGGSNSQEKLRA